MVEQQGVALCWQKRDLTRLTPSCVIQGEEVDWVEQANPCLARLGCWATGAHHELISSVLDIFQHMKLPVVTNQISDCRHMSCKVSR